MLFATASSQCGPETSRGQLKCDGTRAETRFPLSAKRTSPFKSAGASVQSTTGSRGVRISGSNAGYTMLRGSVKCCIRCGPDEDRILDVVPREDEARNSG